MKKIKPPKKLSTAILWALTDIEAVEAQPNTYKVNMSVCHEREEENGKKYGPCHVCFAGSMIANTLKFKPSKRLFFNDFDCDWVSVFASLDKIRMGLINSAVCNFYDSNVCEKIGWLHISQYELAEEVRIRGLRYDQSPTEFKNAMIDIAMYLDSEGL